MAAKLPDIAFNESIIARASAFVALGQCSFTKSSVILDLITFDSMIFLRWSVIFIPLGALDAPVSFQGRSAASCFARFSGSFDIPTIVHAQTRIKIL